MNRFWMALMSIDSRGLLRLVIGLCALIMALSFFMLFRTKVGHENQIPSLVVNEAGTLPRTASHSYSDTPLAASKGDGGNPFRSEYKSSLDDVLRYESERQEREVKEARRMAAEQAEKDAEAKRLAKEKVAADSLAGASADGDVEQAVDSMAISFQGMMTRPDGTRLALIQKGDDAAPEFVPQGASLAGRLLGVVERDRIVLARDGEDVVTLIKGERQEIAVLEDVSDGE